MSSGEQIIEFAPKEIMPGIVVNMQTIYMSWITMAVVALVLLIVSRNPKLVPGKMQLCIEMVFDFIGSLAENNLGEKGKKMMGPFFLTLFMYIFVGNEIGLLPQVFEPMHFHIF